MVPAQLGLVEPNKGRGKCLLPSWALRLGLRLVRVRENICGWIPLWLVLPVVESDMLSCCSGGCTLPAIDDRTSNHAWAIWHLWWESQGDHLALLGKGCPVFLMNKIYLMFGDDVIMYYNSFFFHNILSIFYLHYLLKISGVVEMIRIFTYFTFHFFPITLYIVRRLL